jgi:transcriptional regulator with XRE-family HTH domain
LIGRLNERRRLAIEIGRRIGLARARRGLSMTALADLAGMGQGQVSRTERGEHLPSVFTLATLSRALDVPVSELIDGALLDDSTDRDARQPVK